MRFLSLDRLSGPGKSIAENFECVCLELIKVPDGHDSRAYRISPPDGGVDIFDPTKRIAYQCKAYSGYSGLVSAVTESAQRANRSWSSLQYAQYILMIPFVLTLKQRENVESALREAGAPFSICDGDEIETRLYNWPSIAARFFPTVTVVVLPDHIELTNKMDNRIAKRQIRLVSIRDGSSIPITVSCNTKVGALRNSIKARLMLPDRFEVSAHNHMVFGGTFDWRLSVVRNQREELLSPDVDIEQAGICDDDTIHLSYEQEIEITGGFSKAIGTTLRYYGKITSDIWNYDESAGSLTHRVWDETDNDHEGGIDEIVKHYLGERFNC